jgi:uncharacterized membrane protein HdeD (DUF308 family)
MSNPFPGTAPGIPEDLRELRRYWCWFLTLGSALILVGLFAIIYPAAFTVGTVELFGYLLVFGAVVEVVSGIRSRRWSLLLCGLLYLILGAIMIEHPELSAAIYTLILAIFFVALGVSRLAFGLANRFAGRGWVVLSGVITLALGIMIWRRLPASALWVIGTFVGIELIFNGATWVMLGLGAKSIPAEGATPAGSSQGDAAGRPTPA